MSGTLACAPLAAPTPVSGSTRLFVHLGHPITQVKAPGYMNRLFAARAVDAIMVAIEVAPSGLDAAVSGLKHMTNLDGILVTVPHKIAICRHALHCSDAVRLAGSANALRRHADGHWQADNFDGAGFVAGLHAAGHAVSGWPVALVGAGGAGTAIAAALVLSGIARLSVLDVREAAASELVARLNAYRPGVAAVGRPGDLEAARLVVNATALGMKPGDPLPVPVERLNRDAVVADIVMQPAETALLKAAAQRGLATHGGIHMLEPQIAMYERFFLG